MQKVMFLLVFVILIWKTPTVQAQNLDKEIEAIIGPLVAAISAQTVKNVAIADFTSLDGAPSELGKYIAEEFSYHLVNAKKSFIVIDRSRVAALLKENGLGTSGLVDPNTITKLGKMKGIDAVIAGTMTPTGNTIRLIVKVWNLETQGLVAASRGDISKTPMISELESKQGTIQGGNGGTSTEPKILAAPAISKFTKNHVTFELLSCTQMGQNIECRVRVTSVGKDNDLHVHIGKYGVNESRMIASTGNEYALTESRLGDKMHSNSWGAKSLVSNVPLVCSFVFSKVLDKVTLIPKIEIYSGIDNIGNFHMEFRNIPVK